LPIEVESVFHKMIAKNPADRFQSMGEVADALQRVEDGNATLAVVEARQRALTWSQQRLVWTSATLACAGVCILLLVLWWPRGNDQEPLNDPGRPIADRDAVAATSPTDDPLSKDPEESGQQGLESESPIRDVAERILALGGTVDLVAGQEMLTGLAASERLPSGQFDILRITLADRAVQDSDLAEIGKLTTLQYLNLANSNVSSAGIRFLAGSPELRTLYLSTTRVDNSGMAVIAQLPVLEELDIRNTPVDDVGVAQLSHCRSLRTLRLGEGQPLTSGALASLAEMTWLTSLGLRGAPVDDNGVQQISTLAGLTWLDLGSTNITDGAGPHLMQFAQLSHLLLDGTGVTSDQIEALRRSLPQCEITD
jgi:hypothetical protein